MFDIHLGVKESISNIIYYIFIVFEHQEKRKTFLPTGVFKS